MFKLILYTVIALAVISPVHADITADKPILVSKRQISRTHYEYTYQANAFNSDQNAYSEVLASIRSTNAATRIVDSVVSFNFIAAKGSAISQDTFSIQQDRRLPFDPSSLLFTFSARNAAPIADAGIDQKAASGDVVTLDASLSNDPNNDKLSYSWRLSATPDGSSAKLSDTTTANPQFTADKGGVYLAELIVSDNKLGSIADTVRVTASEPEINLPDSVKEAFGANPSFLDSDGDDLPDTYEILKTAPHLMPNTADTDGNGLSDKDEDLDGDGLTTFEEFTLGTNPLSADSDGDGLSDKDEIARLTNPLDPDTDQDGLTDGDEVNAGTDPTIADTDKNGVIDSLETLTTSVENTNTGLSLELNGKGFLGHSVSINDLSDTPNSRFHNAIGQVGHAVEINLDSNTTGRLEKATVTLSYDPDSDHLGDVSDLRVFTFDEELNFWVPASNDQVLDADNHTISATVNHFSIFAIFNITNWKETWNAEANVCSVRDTPIDLVFSIDSSGSMRSNDPDNLRLQAAKSFVNALIPEDRGAVIDFDSSTHILQSLTDNKSALKSAINKIDSSGGTDISDGVAPAISMLRSASSDERGKAVVLLTDGVGSYNHSLTSSAASNKIRIFTIGLGDSVDKSLLSSIASGTGAKANFISHSSQLPDVFRTVEIDSGIAGDTDTDGDGLTDTEELEGVYDVTGRKFTSDPDKVDTDGDGLTDFEELGNALTLEEVKTVLKKRGINVELDDDKCYYNVIADPEKIDTDGDGLSDGEELDGSFADDTASSRTTSDPRITDTDGDGLNDFEEASWGTNPVSSDTDRDGFSDSYEASRLDKGYHPISFTVRKSKLTYVKEFAVGALCGEICDLDTLAELTGNIAAGVTPAAGTIRDIIDAVALAFKGDYVGSGITVVGILPIGGDAVVIVSRTLKFTERNLSKADDIIQLIAKSDWASDSVRKELLQGIGERAFKEALDTLRSKGFSDDTLLRLAKGKATKFSNLAAMVSRPNATIVKSGGKFYEGKTGWRKAEEFLRGGSGSPGRFPKGEPKDFIRYPDAAIGRVGMEAKTGYQKYSKRIRDQIEKDAQLITSRELNDFEWHFFASGRSNSIGLDPRLLDELDKAGIRYFFHIP